jgi:hypothetical protein
VNKKNQRAALNERIDLLQSRHTLEFMLLKGQFHHTYNSLKPINLFKRTLKEAIESPGLKENIFNTSVGLATGYISKLLFIKVSHSPLRKILGFALQFGITKIVAKHPEEIKSFGNGVLNLIRNKFSERCNGSNHNETK